MLLGARAVPAAGYALSWALGSRLDPVMLPALWRTMVLPQAMPDAMASGFSFERARRPAQLVSDAENAAALWPDLARSALGQAGGRAPVHVLCGRAGIVVNELTQTAPAAALISGARRAWMPGIVHVLHHARADAVVEAVSSLSGGQR